jgi:hypothetical protein
VMAGGTSRTGSSSMRAIRIAKGIPVVNTVGLRAGPLASARSRSPSAGAIYPPVSFESRLVHSTFPASAPLPRSSSTEISRGPFDLRCANGAGSRANIGSSSPVVSIAITGGQCPSTTP